MIIFNHTFKQAKPLLWKIERAFKLNLLKAADYWKSRTLYDCFLVVSYQYKMRYGRQLDFNDDLDWGIFLAELNIQTKYN